MKGRDWVKLDNIGYSHAFIPQVSYQESVISDIILNITDNEKKKAEIVMKFLIRLYEIFEFNIPSLEQIRKEMSDLIKFGVADKKLQKNLQKLL